MSCTVFIYSGKSILAIKILGGGGAYEYQTRNTVSKAKMIVEIAKRQKRSGRMGMYKDKKGLTVGVMKGDVKPKGLVGDD